MFKTSFRNTILDAMKQRGWTEADKGNKDWDFHWADVHWIVEFFREGGKVPCSCARLPAAALNLPACSSRSTSASTTFRTITS